MSEEYTPFQPPTPEEAEAMVDSAIKNGFEVSLELPEGTSIDTSLTLGQNARKLMEAGTPVLFRITNPEDEGDDLPEFSEAPTCAPEIPIKDNMLGESFIKGTLNVIVNADVLNSFGDEASGKTGLDVAVEILREHGFEIDAFAFGMAIPKDLLESTPFPGDVRYVGVRTTDGVISDVLVYKNQQEALDNMRDAIPEDFTEDQDQALLFKHVELPDGSQTVDRIWSHPGEEES